MLYRSSKLSPVSEFSLPDHVVDTGSIRQPLSPTALCQSFDADADGYVKAEAVSCVIVKRHSLAIADRDPIRAIVRGTASNSDGRTSSIASPSAQGQAAVIRQAYANAGITNFNETAYLDRSPDQPLLIGSVKSNIGHLGPAAGDSDLLKAILAMEKDVVPGTPLFIQLNPKIPFKRFKVRASRTAAAGPDEGFPLRRASINSFRCGGSNAHAFIEKPNAEQRSFFVSSYAAADETKNFFDDKEPTSQSPHLFVVTADDANSLKNNIQALSNHLVNPRVKVGLSDLAYTFSERRSRMWQKGFITTRTTKIEAANFTASKFTPGRPDAKKISLVFTGEGAEWPQMEREMLDFFPSKSSVLEELDDVLQAQPSPSAWSLIRELSEPRTTEHMRQPELFQPLVMALQMCIFEMLKSWGVHASSVVGYGSGEIAAAYAAGLLDRAGATKAAFYRGRTVVNRKDEVEAEVDILAVDLGAETVSQYMEKYAGDCWISYFNSNYRNLLKRDAKFKPGSSIWRAKMFSSVTAAEMTGLATAACWTSTMISPVRFEEALTRLVEQDAPSFLIEIGPSGALAGPVSQTLEKLPGGAGVSYCAAWSRGANAGHSLFDVAGYLFLGGADIDLALVNGYNREAVRTIVDLPNYCWNHTIKY
ncbi:polyketide synthase [Colletotrichum musicola]|uniref:Polyketide synthase n=1 Tax=Colletotrichum musicola TaxID=2175873 RepID=A0A8H6JWU5_9PEZI|nr:polyketide synthase [Colletotrichum musicola]